MPLTGILCLVSLPPKGALSDIFASLALTTETQYQMDCIMYCDPSEGHR